MDCSEHHFEIEGVLCTFSLPSTLFLCIPTGAATGVSVASGRLAFHSATLIPPLAAGGPPRPPQPPPELPRQPPPKRTYTREGGGVPRQPPVEKDAACDGRGVKRWRWQDSPRVKNMGVLMLGAYGTRL